MVGSFQQRTPRPDMAGVIEEDAMSTPQGGQPGNGQDGRQWSGFQPESEPQDDAGATTVYRPGDMGAGSSPAHAAGSSGDTGPQPGSGSGGQQGPSGQGYGGAGSQP